MALYSATSAPLRKTFVIVFGVVLRTTPLDYCFKALIGHFNLLQQPLGQLRIEMMSTAVSHNVANQFATGQGQVADHIQ